MDDLHKLSLTCKGIWHLMQSDKTLKVYQTIAKLKYWDSFRFSKEHYKFGIRKLWIPSYYFYNSENYQPCEPPLVVYKEKCSEICQGIEINYYSRDYGTMELSYVYQNNLTGLSEREMLEKDANLQRNLVEVFRKIGIAATIDTTSIWKDNENVPIERLYTYKLLPKAIK